MCHLLRNMEQLAIGLDHGILGVTDISTTGDFSECMSSGPITLIDTIMMVTLTIEFEKYSVVFYFGKLDGKDHV